MHSSVFDRGVSVSWRSTIVFNHCVYTYRIEFDFELGRGLFRLLPAQRAQQKVRAFLNALVTDGRKQKTDVDLQSRNIDSTFGKQFL
jgi:hypothetical protein